MTPVSHLDRTVHPLEGHWYMYMNH